MGRLKIKDQNEQPEPETDVNKSMRIIICQELLEITTFLTNEKAAGNFIEY